MPFCRAVRKCSRAGSPPIRIVKFEGHDACGLGDNALAHNHNERGQRLADRDDGRNVAMAYCGHGCDRPINTVSNAGQEGLLTPSITYMSAPEFTINASTEAANTVILRRLTASA